MASSHLDDLIAIASAWNGKLPSELALYYMPELRRRHVTPADLFAFDVAATARLVQLRQTETPNASSKMATTTGQPAAATQPRSSHTHRPVVVEERGDHLSIRGSEIPPWDPRYRGKKRGAGGGGDGGKP